MHIISNFIFVLLQCQHDKVGHASWQSASQPTPSADEDAGGPGRPEEGTNVFPVLQAGPTDAATDHSDPRPHKSHQHRGSYQHTYCKYRTSINSS